MSNWKSLLKYSNTSIEEIKEQEKEHNQYFFGEETLKYFSEKIINQVYEGENNHVYVITCYRSPDKSYPNKKFYRIARVSTVTWKTKFIGKGNTSKNIEFDTLIQAQKYILKLQQLNGVEHSPIYSTESVTGIFDHQYFTRSDYTYSYEPEYSGRQFLVYSEIIDESKITTPKNKYKYFVKFSLIDANPRKELVDMYAKEDKDNHVYRLYTQGYQGVNYHLDEILLDEYVNTLEEIKKLVEVRVIQEYDYRKKETYSVLKFKTKKDCQKYIEILASKDFLNVKDWLRCMLDDRYTSYPSCIDKLKEVF